MTPGRRFKLRNWLQSALLIVAMMLLAAACFWSLWGPAGVWWAVGGIALALFIGPTIPKTFLLSLYRARLMGSRHFPELHAILAELAKRADLASVPDIYYLPSAMPNAFAVGTPASSAIALSDGLLRRLNQRELVGVLAHEVSHIKSNDLWVMSLADVLSRATAILSHLGLLLLVLNLPLALAGMATVPWLVIALLIMAPMLMNLLQLALSRSREFDADLDAARLTQDPVGMASALEKMDRFQGLLWERLLLPGRRTPAPSLLRSHPATEERVRRLLALPRREERPRPSPPEHPLPVPPGLRRVQGRPRWRWPGLWY